MRENRLIKNTVAKQFVITILLVFVLQSFMLAIILRSFYKSTIEDTRALGVSNLRSQATMVENYLNKGGDALWFAAETMDHMLGRGAGNEECLEYLQYVTERMQQEFDSNFTGIYGLIEGGYLDGSGWEPPEGFDPKTRSWYIEALEGRGQVVLSSPYMDAQTGKMIVSYSRMLSDGASVLSMDIVLDEVQSIAESMTMKGQGYGFITDSDGLVIAHTDPGEVGRDYAADPEWGELFSGEETDGKYGFEMRTGRGNSTVFTERIAMNWRVVIVAQNAQLYHRLWLQLVTGVLLSLMIFAVIVVFCVGSAYKIDRAELNEDQSRERLQNMNMNIMRSLASAIDAKDRYTSGHSQRVAEYAVEIARRMGKSEEELQIIYYTGILHDVGKIRVPEDVINKPGRLTEEEFDQIRIHPVSGYHILRGIHEDAQVGYGAKYHHERYDGTGYPNGLMGEEIPEIARIIAVADAYDAMASDRSYRRALPQQIVRDEILKGKGTQFDPAIADVMLEIIDEDREYRLRQTEDRIYNVLVVDDDEMSIVIVEHILRSMEELRVIGVSTKQEAFNVLNRTGIDLILIDLRMPDTDGFELYQQIRRDYGMPVILMTGDRSMEIIQRIRELGIDDYLTKPFNWAITAETVRSLVHRVSWPKTEQTEVI